MAHMDTLGTERPDAGTPQAESTFEHGAPQKIEHESLPEALRPRKVRDMAVSVKSGP